MECFGFHPLIAAWFRLRFAAPTEPQAQGWPAIAAGESTLIAAPTGSGKTLTAFLACIDRLVKEGLASPGGPALPDETRVVYVSPLRALSNDMHRNLEEPLAEIAELAAQEGWPLPPIRTGLRTGDTSSSARAKLVRKPPHILVTTPESLYLLLTSKKGRAALGSVETVIVDEIHALVRDKRGSHLALTLERLEALAGRPLQRIGLSATQKPIERIAEFLTGRRAGEGRPAVLDATHRTATLFEVESRDEAVPRREDTGILTPTARPCTIVDVGHARELDLAIEVPPSELGAVCMHEQWAEVNERLVELIREHRSTLIFVNTRRMAERVTHQLTALLGEEVVGAHHGSLAADARFETERRLKAGMLQAVVATASLELGLDIGYIDLVVQIGSPRAIATFLQRIGRSGHALGLVPKGRLFALTRDELLECMALVRAVRAGRLDAVRIPESPLDILAQQIVAETVGREWNGGDDDSSSEKEQRTGCGTDELFELFRQAWPYRDLSREDFDRTIEYLSEGVARQAGRSRVHLHHDRVGRRIRARRGARIVATSNGGAIPEIASYRVVAEPEMTVVGTLDEEFAVETNAGDVFLLGNTSWRIRHVRGNDVTVTDAQGASPTIPFWQGEAPGRTLELSEEVSRLREELETRLDDPPALENWLREETCAPPWAAQQAVLYAAAQKAAIGLLPTQRRVVFERFFDETGGMQLVVHAPFGGAINKAWGFAMRKRFCRSFDFELQATADDDGFILSLGPQHSFPIESLFGMLTAENARGLLEQAVLTVPMFEVRWRWNVTRALLVQRMRNGKKVPPALQRFLADDLLTAVFPKLTGCQEEHTGDHEVPDHPLARQTMTDCLTEALDLPGLLDVLRRIAGGEIELAARDTREPSPFSYELLNAAPYAFLDGGEAQERRTRVVSSRRSLTVESVRDLGRLDPEAIEQVRREAQPLVRDADELHDALLGRIVLPEEETEDARDWLWELAEDGRAGRIALPDGRGAWVAAERLPMVEAVFPGTTTQPPLVVPEGVRTDWESVEARVTIVRGLLETCGPITGHEVAARIAITIGQADAALEALEGEGVVLRGRFTPDDCGASDTTSASDLGVAQRHAGSRSDEKPRLPLDVREEISVALGGIHSTNGIDEPDDECSDSSPGNPEGAASCRGRDPSFGLATREVSDEGTDASITAPVEWCHRRLLSRIHRLTLEGLRKQIEPVSREVFLRFLFRHHGVLPEQRRSGANGLFEIVQILQGIDVPASAWESDVLSARLESYDPAWLDELCVSGEVGWGRLHPPKRDPERGRPMASVTRAVPVSLWLRSDLAWLADTTVPVDEFEGLSGASQDVHEMLSERGAMFSADLADRTRLLPSHLEDALGELISRGLVTADGFAGLRNLVAPKPVSRREGLRAGPWRQRRTSQGAGRWSLWRNGEFQETTEPPEVLRPPLACEEWAWQLLRRWGVVFRDLLDREPGAPRWFELLQVYRRLEARGEIRGGRFVSGVGGEQFALGDSIRVLRQLRDDGPRGELVVVSAADPLNLTGILGDARRVPALATNRVAFLDGELVAARIGGEPRWFAEFDDKQRHDIAVHLGLAGRTLWKLARTAAATS